MYRVRVRAGDSPATGEVWFGVFPAARPQAAARLGLRHARHRGRAGADQHAAGVRGDGRPLGAVARFRRFLPLARRRAGEGPVRVARRRDRRPAQPRLHDPGQPRPSAAVGRPAASRRSRTTAVGPARRRATWPSGRTTSSRRSSTSATASGTGKCGTSRAGRASSAARRRNTRSCSRWPIAPSSAPTRRRWSSAAASRRTRAEWTKRVLAQDGLDFMDALSYHVYWSPAVTEPAAPGEPTFIEQEVRHFVDLMRERGKPQADLHDRRRHPLPAVRLVAAEGRLQPRRAVRLARPAPSAR